MRERTTTMTRRRLLQLLGLASPLASACRDSGGTEADSDETAWAEARRAFGLSPGTIHMSALLIASHPRPVQEAIERYRRELDRDPVAVLERHNDERISETLSAAAGYLGVDRSSVALTDSTTMGLALIYNGLRLRPGDEVITTEHDYYATHESLRLAAEKTGAIVRQVPAYGSLESVTEEEIATRLVGALTPATRALAVTWVHSGTGLKLPVQRIAEALERVNASREDAERVLLCVDGVHGFGVEAAGMGDLRCDFFAAGTHKWIFGPRGTGIVWGSGRGWPRIAPTIPSFIDSAAWTAWTQGTEPPGTTDGRRLSPGGFKPFEHQWALKEAFEFHRQLGKKDVQAWTHRLASRLKDGLAAMGHVRLVTPRSPELSSGIVCFDVDGLDPDAVVRRLGDKDIIATVTPYAVRHARLTPSIRNTPREVDTVLEAVRALG